MEPRQWFMWFMRNYDHGPLIAAGLWKKPAFINEDLSDEDVDALHAGFLLGGAAAVWPILVSLIKDEPIPLPSEVEVMINSWDGAPRAFVSKWGSDDKAINRALKALIDRRGRQRLR
jgi:hypothetical protein